MRAMLLDAPRTRLRLVAMTVPEPGPGQVLIRVHACAVCRTDLHVVDGELDRPKLPLVPGHEIVGTVHALGSGASRFQVGDRVGVPWLGWTVRYVRATAVRGGRISARTRASPATRSTAAMPNTRWPTSGSASRSPTAIRDLEAAPLLCAGLIGYRSLRMTGEARRLGLYGFGAAAHIIAQVARHQGKEVYAFTRPGDADAQEFARSLGAVWAGGSDRTPPEPLDAAIIFAPVGALVPAALRAVGRAASWCARAFT